ncbi:MAG: hypothetical protein CL940_05270 [Deltaproteobacteria bacterium]|nr:hypothetical protein [Deltaproteobacteria bacterium]
MTVGTTGRRASALLVFALALCACSASEVPQLYGAATTPEALQSRAKPLTTLQATDAGTDVVVSGTIGRVCKTMGCWFYLTEGEAMVYVDLEQGSRFTVPVDSTGKRAVIEGAYKAEGGDARLVAKSAAVWP